MSTERERFSPSELAVVLSHYDLGVIESAKEYPRGSRQSPKLLLRTVEGRQFMLKRRAAGRDDPFKVAFAHSLAGHLVSKRFPVPALVGTRVDQNSMLELGGSTYELFEYVSGDRYTGTLEQTTEAGLMLARFHKAVRDFDTEWTSPEGTYHDSPLVHQGLNAIPSTTSSHDSALGHEAELLTLTQTLHELYDQAAAEVNHFGLADWPQEIIHSDWHPGNMLFRGDKVVAVLDLDSARRQPRVIDVANGMLQFSILRGRTDPNEWPEFFDETRMRRFIYGYMRLETLTPEQRRVIPHLLIESLIAESVVPIAVTGSFGWLPGFGVLQMVHRKTQWILNRLPRLVNWLLE